MIDGGAIHGIPQPSGGQTTELALFPFDRPSEQFRQLKAAIGEAEVIEVMPQLSRVRISGVGDKDPEITFKAVVTSLPLPPKGILIAGEEAGVQLAGAALQERSSLYVREVSRSESAEFKLLARDRQYLITRPADDRTLVAQIQGYTPATALQAIQRLEHIARWTNIAELSSPATSRIRPDAVQMVIERDGQELQDDQVRLEYRQSNGKWKQPTFKIKLKNTSNEALYCALLDLTDRYSVSAGLFDGGGIWLRPGEEAWALGGQPIYPTLPEKLWKQGITEIRDILKLIVSSAEFDATLLEQEELDLPWRGTRTASRGRGTLNRLMNRVQLRELRAKPESEELYDDWVTSQIAITTVRPLEATPIPRGGEISLGSGVRLQSHDSLKANVRLTTVTQSTRDLGNHILPPILRADNEGIQPFVFTASRGTDPGLSALELTQVEDPSTVTRADPLKLVVDARLNPDEQLLPIAYDGEFFLPLGRGYSTSDGQIEIELERLPEPVSEGSRSLGGSIRIFFQKVLSQKLALEFPYPILAVADVASDETVRYEGELEKVRSRIAFASRIVLYIHGIIGDTQSMVPSVQRAKIEVDGQQKPLAELYDLVLGFDYENINTSIEENARLLKKRLEAVGLGANHGKVLHIVAHSMGGLVSRWLIEREGGNQVVQHLIMLGTPNAGSPWPTVQAWGTAALAIGLNSLSTVAWPASVLGSLVTAIGTIDTTLKQMQPGSDFVKSLESSPDPGIPYTIIAGNTSVIPAVMEANRLKRLMQLVVNEVVSLPFFGQPNDIAATVYSIKSVRSGRSPQPQIQEIGCAHLVYFSHPAGLAALSTAVSQAQREGHKTQESGKH